MNSRGDRLNIYHFPARAQQRSLVASVNKMREEFAEFLTALTSEPVDNQVEELWDLIQTMEQHMRDYQALGVDVFSIRQRVQDKCRDRGLYREILGITLSPSEAQTGRDAEAKGDDPK